LNEVNGLRAETAIMFQLALATKFSSEVLLALSCQHCKNGPDYREFTARHLQE